MDPRRFLIVAAGGLLLSGCAILRPNGGSLPVTPVTAPLAAATPASDDGPIAPAPVEADAIRETTDPADSAPAEGTPYLSLSSPGSGVALARPDAVPEEAAATAPDRRAGAVRIFGWSPGRVYEVRTAPLRVTTLTLGHGETLVAKAAGDTVRWQIGEAASGSGSGLRIHVLLKPLERGLETNLVLTTNRRVYFLDLRSGPASDFDPAVTWDDGTDTPAAEAGVTVGIAADETVRIADPVAMPDGPLDARYRIEPQGRRPRWTPASVFNDGRRTFIAFDADLQIDEAPTLSVIAPDGERQMVNYRQAGGLFIVDRVFDRAELRLGDRRPQIVRLQRLEGARP